MAEDGYTPSGNNMILACSGGSNLDALSPQDSKATGVNAAPA